MTETVRSLSTSLTPKQEAFVIAYLDEDFIWQAAQEIGISERTARRWLASPSIQATIAQLRQERREMRENRLAVCMDRAIDIVADTLLYASDSSEAERTGHYIDRDTAFKYVSLMFKYGHDQKEIDALKLRVAQLEAQAVAPPEPVVDGTITRLPARQA